MAIFIIISPFVQYKILWDLLLFVVSNTAAIQNGGIGREVTVKMVV